MEATEERPKDNSMCYSILPQINYGQGKGNAYNPSNRGAVYQQVQRAAKDADFARNFATDIIFGKPTGSSYYVHSVKTTTNPETGHKTKEDVYTKQRPQNTDGEGWLYNKNSLNGSKSWVAQAFGNPVVKDADGNWRVAKSVVDHRALPHLYTPRKSYGFRGDGVITDAQTVRMLNEGHYAFKATGYDGSEVYVPWASGYIPAKGEAGRPEAENTKNRTEKTGATARRDMVSPATAEPDNVIAGRSLLGTARDKKKTLG
jgi:hypothetical protein